MFIGLLSTVAMAPVAVAGEASRGSRWPVGVSRAPEPPIARPAHAAMVALDERVLLVGGGEYGEGVGRADNHRDGAILDLRTGRWRRIAAAPFGMVAGSGVSTGDSVILFGLEIGCSVMEGERSCRGGTVRAARYDLEDDEWRELRLPADFRRASSGVPLAVLWNGEAAVFFSFPSFLEVTERGRVRVVPAERDLSGAAGGVSGVEFGPCAVDTTVAVTDFALVRPARAERDPHPGELALYESRRRSLDDRIALANRIRRCSALRRRRGVPRGPGVAAVESGHHALCAAHRQLVERRCTSNARIDRPVLSGRRVPELRPPHVVRPRAVPRRLVRRARAGCPLRHSARDVDGDRSRSRGRADRVVR